MVVLLQDQSKKPNPTSCRAGAVVHMLAATGAKIPVTLKLSKKEAVGTGPAMQIVQVEPVISSCQMAK